MIMMPCSLLIRYARPFSETLSRFVMNLRNSRSCVKSWTKGMHSRASRRDRYSSVRPTSMTTARTITTPARRCVSQHGRTGSFSEETRWICRSTQEPSSRVPITDLVRPGFSSCASHELTVDAVFALFSAEIRMIDHMKRAALSHYLLDNVTSTIPGDKLDEKLASLTLFSDASDRALLAS